MCTYIGVCLGKIDLLTLSKSSYVNRLGKDHITFNVFDQATMRHFEGLFSFSWARGGCFLVIFHSCSSEVHGGTKSSSGKIYKIGEIS